MSRRAPIKPWEPDVGVTARPWGDSGRVSIIRREYALYDDVMLDGRPVGMVWLRAGTEWCYSMWEEPDAHRTRAIEASSFDDAVTRILWRTAPELVPSPKPSD